MKSLQCPLEISSCNTRLAKVKFRLKKTQLKTIFNSRPEGKLFKGNCSRGNGPWGNFKGSNCPRNSSPGGELFTGNCPEGNIPGEISWETIFRGQLSRLELSLNLS